jgi:hypothetical protein
MRFPFGLMHRLDAKRAQPHLTVGGFNPGLKTLDICGGFRQSAQTLHFPTCSLRTTRVSNKGLGHPDLLIIKLAGPTPIGKFQVPKIPCKTSVFD